MYALQSKLGVDIATITSDQIFSQNLPFICEEQEQNFFEMIILLVLDTLLGQLNKELTWKSGS